MAKRPNRYRRKQERIRAERAEAFRDAFANWADAQPSYLTRVADAVRDHPDIPLTYRKDAKRSPSTLTPTELAVTLRAVEEWGDSLRGLSYRRLQAAFALVGVGKGRAKAAAALRTLVALGIIRRTGNYSTNHKWAKGNLYKVNYPKTEPDGLPF